MTTHTDVAVKPLNTSPPIFESGYYAKLSHAKNPDDLKRRIHEIVKCLGLSHYAYINLNNVENPDQALNTLPPELSTSYYNAGLFEYDMNLQRARDNSRPFFSSTTHDYTAAAPFASDMTRCMHEIQKLNNSFGYYDFYNIPIASTDNPGRALLSVTQQGASPVDLQRTVNDCKSTLHLLGEAIDAVVIQHFADDFIRCEANKHRPVTINAKPLRVLNTLANNDFTIHEVAETLCISIVTVNQHLRTARNRLGTKTNYAAIKQAIQAGLIKFTNQPTPTDATNDK